MSLPALGSLVKLRGPEDRVLVARVCAYTNNSVVLGFSDESFHFHGTCRRELYLSAFRGCFIGGAS